MDDLIYFNGVDGATGGYLRPPVPFSRVEQKVRRFRPDNETTSAADEGRPVRAGVKPDDLRQAGWGVVFAPGTPPEVREALAPLLALRREMAGGLYQELELLPGETKREFLARHGEGPGLANPSRVPYHLLLAGGPEEIPFEVQFHLGVQRAVGRLHLESPDACAAYARNVIEAELGPPRRTGRAAFFAPIHPGDAATRSSAERMTVPLAETFRKERTTWEVEIHDGDKATKDRLSRLLGGEETPGLLFTAGHGLGFAADDDRQATRQGALLCREWPGPEVGFSHGLPESWYFAAEDLPSSVDLGGLVCICFACHSAGTPRQSAFAVLGAGRPKRLAERAFMARLPQRLLAQGALAVVGHIDQAWETSFSWPGAGDQLTTFESALWKLGEGCRIGQAMEPFGGRWSEIAADLGGEPEESEKAWLWLAHNDARGYVLLGDPAARWGR